MDAGLVCVGFVGGGAKIEGGVLEQRIDMLFPQQSGLRVSLEGMLDREHM